MIKVHQKTRTFLIALLALLLTAARASAQKAVTIVQTDGGTITADHAIATEGQTVTLTVVPSQGYHLKNASLLVEKIANPNDADHPQQSNRRAPVVGGFIDWRQSTPTIFTFQMPETDVEVTATFVKAATFDIDASETEDMTKPVSGVGVTVSDNGNGTVTINTVVVPEAQSTTPIAISIPRNVTDVNGHTYEITDIAPFTLFGQTNITDVYLPETDEPLQVDLYAFRLDNEEGSSHHIPVVHTPLYLLDDYALMSSLSENYETMKIQATAMAIHKYWTFSCGVDILLPEGVKMFICEKAEGTAVTIRKMEGATVVKANNGVLLASTDNEGHQYEMVVKPSSERPSGMIPPIGNAASYEGNLLEPVIESEHYDGDDYYILLNNEFHRILQEGADARVPACKAVLHLPE